jgi:hypothetical protein
MAYELPTERSTPMESLTDYIILCYGEKKIGKTSMFSHYGDAFFAMFEPGSKALALYEDTMGSWIKFRQFVKAMEKDEKHGTIVIDTADEAYQRCMEYVCKKMGMDHPSDEGYGKGWNAVRTEFTRQISRLCRTGKGIVLISHSVEREIKQRQGGTYDRIMPTMSGQARDVIESMTDIWCYYGYDGGDRILWIQGDELISAGNRLDERFRYSDSGERIKQIPMGTSSEESWGAFLDAFNNELPDPVVEAPKPRRKKKRRKDVG